jgi:hypothetical protein
VPVGTQTNQQSYISGYQQPYQPTYMPGYDPAYSMSSTDRFVAKMAHIQNTFRPYGPYGVMSPHGCYGHSHCHYGGMSGITTPTQYAGTYIYT